MDASTSDGALPTRRVYIDAGANWANTLRLYRDIEPTASTAPWEVYAFEASPLITPFLERYCTWLDGGGIGVAPSSCLPQSGSTAHLLRYTSAVGCPASRECMWSFFAKPLAALAPDPRLNSTKLIQKRLAKAQRASSRTRYTLIPAGVAAENTHITIDSNPQQLIRGGALTVDAKQSRYTLKPVDTAAALGSGSASLPSLPQPHLGQGAPLVLGSAASPFEATHPPALQWSSQG